MTVVVDAADLKSEDAYEAVEAHLDAGFFVTYEIFEGERSDQGFFEATLRAAEQSGEQDKRERNMAVAYFYYADALSVVVPDGMVGHQHAPRPALTRGHGVGDALAEQARELQGADRHGAPRRWNCHHDEEGRGASGMKAWPYRPGVPAAGHVTASGFWHPGPI